MLSFSLPGLRDPRLSSLLRVGGGEGYAVYAGQFEGKPAVIADCSTLNEFAHADDLVAEPIRVSVFDDEDERDRYVASLRKA